MCRFGMSTRKGRSGKRGKCSSMLMFVCEQVSVMSTFERRAMGIPMFAPSLDLITRWHMEYGLVFERRFSPP